MKHYFFCFLTLFGAILVGCNKPQVTPTTPQIVNTPSSAGYRSLNSAEEATLIANYSSRTDGVFYQTLPEGYTPMFSGQCNYSRVYVFVQTEEKTRSEFYFFDNEEDELVMSGIIEGGEETDYLLYRARNYVHQTPTHCAYWDCAAKEPIANCMVSVDENTGWFTIIY